jgi:hypothetical protein
MVLTTLVTGHTIAMAAVTCIVIRVVAWLERRKSATRAYSTTPPALRWYSALCMLAVGLMLETVHQVVCHLLLGLAPQVDECVMVPHVLVCRKCSRLLILSRPKPGRQGGTQSSGGRFISTHYMCDSLLPCHPKCLATQCHSMPGV